MLRFRHLLLCLLMLALPMQGFAAASMLFCGMGVGHGTTTEQMGLVSSHHHTAGSTDMQHDHANHGETAQTTKQLPDATHKCGVCAACCSVVAISDFSQTVEVQSPLTAYLVEPFVRINAVPSRLPDKPPRA